MGFDFSTREMFKQVPQEDPDLLRKSKWVRILFEDQKKRREVLLSHPAKVRSPTTISSYLHRPSGEASHQILFRTARKAPSWPPSIVGHPGASLSPTVSPEVTSGRNVIREEEKRPSVLGQPTSVTKVSNPGRP